MPPPAAESSIATELSSIIKTWELIDLRSESRYVTDYADTKHLMSTFDSLHPNKNIERKQRTDELIANVMVSTPGEDYEGPTLSWPLTESEVEALVIHTITKSHIHLHVSYICRLLVEAKTMFARMSPVTRVTSTSGDHKRLVVVGDLHGQLADLITIFIENGFPSPTGTQYVFNGDFVDRGMHSVEVVTILLAFKLLYPNTVHLNRGNHETINMNLDFGFMDEVIAKYQIPQILSIYVGVWDSLPIATLIDDAVLVLHGGLFRNDGIKVSHLETIPKKDNDLCSNSQGMLLLTDALWSDPQEAPGRQLGLRGSGTIQFGPDVTRRFLTQNHLDLLIRSHQVPSTGQGYEVLHGGKCITVFSASNYCGSQGNMGGVVIFEPGKEVSFREFWAPPLEVLAHEFQMMSEPAPMPPSAATQRSDSSLRAKQVVLDELSALIIRHNGDLQWFYKGCPQDDAGRIAVEDWVEGLRTVLRLDIDWATFTPDILGDVTVVDDAVDFRAFLSAYKVTVAPAYNGWVEELKATMQKRLREVEWTVSDYFQMFDKNGDGKIEAQELRTALNENLGITLSREQSEVMLSSIASPGKDLDVLSFLEGLQMQYSGKDHSPEVQSVIRAIEDTLAKSSKNVLEIFKALDYNGDGLLSLSEIQQFLKWLSDKFPNYAAFADPTLAEKVMQAFDENDSGTISLLEFLDNFRPSAAGYTNHVEALVQGVARSLYYHKPSLKALFYRMDVDGRGYLTRKQLREGLRTLTILDGNLTNEELDLVAQHVDSNEDGQISWQEFINAFEMDTAALAPR